MSQQEDRADEEVRVLLREYEQFLSSKAVGTREAYLRTVRHLMGWVAQLPGNAGRFQPQYLTQTTVEEYLLYLEQEGFGLSHRARVKSTVSNFARFLIEEKRLLRRNPTRGIELPPVSLLTPGYLSAEQRTILHSLIKQAADIRGAALFAMSYWAGCRVSEISWLQMVHTHVGPREGWLRVGYDEKNWRDIDLMNQACEPLYNYLQDTRNTQRTYVFFSQRSERLTEEGIYYWFRMLKTQVPWDQEKTVANVSFHDLRRDFARRTQEAGWSLEEMAYYLGSIAGQGTPDLQTTVPPAQVSREQVKLKLKDIEG